MTHPSRSPRLRLRLSNRRTDAEEFVVHLDGSPADGRRLRDGSERALDRYERRHGGPVTLDLQIAASPTHEARGWSPLVRNTLPVTVFVSRVLLDRRPPDDWTEIAAWCRAARVQDDAITQVVEDVALCYGPSCDRFPEEERPRD